LGLRLLPRLGLLPRLIIGVRLRPPRRLQIESGAELEMETCHPQIPRVVNVDGIGVAVQPFRPRDQDDRSTRIRADLTR
jgi:hypothetical protein